MLVQHKRYSLSPRRKEKDKKGRREEGREGNKEGREEGKEKKISMGNELKTTVKENFQKVE